MGRDELISPELQLFEIETYARRNNIEIAYVIHDIDRSGRSFTKRRVSEAIEGIKQGRWRYVLLWKWSRWGRNLQASLTYLAAVEEAGGMVRAATEDFDPTTTMGKFTRDQMLLIAELQSNQIGDGWREAQAKRRREGLPHTSRPRFGYDYIRGRGYVINADEAPLVEEAYSRYIAGEGSRTLAVEWNLKGILTKNGKRWTDTSIRNMLDTGFAAGWIRERSDQTDSHRRSENFDIWRTGAHQPIIDDRLWEQYKARRVEMARMPVRLRRATHALSGLLTCGFNGCGRVMIAMYAGTKRYLNWRCKYAFDTKIHDPNSLSDARAQHLILTWIETEAVGGEQVDVLARMQAEADQAGNEIDAHKRQVSLLIAKRKRLVDAFTEGKIEDEDYEEKRTEVKKQLDEATRSLAQAETRAASDGISAVRAFGVLREEWPRLSPQGRNLALRQVVRSIVINPGPYQPCKITVIPRWTN